LLRTDYPNDWKHYDFMEVLFKPRHMTPEELGEGVAQVYRDTTSRRVCLKRALKSAVQTRDLLGSAVAYFGNRGAGTLWRESAKERAHL